ncbi:hypothetical protein EEL33_12455 [Muribaculaceae bacterium Isolate-037 (Harlan)]|jgi:hypothetical protein|nr:hypothetical protein EEL33_12455 [Muribaculaceae bacterium Isolate-037 (Harlan)]
MKLSKLRHKISLIQSIHKNKSIIFEKNRDDFLFWGEAVRIYSMFLSNFAEKLSKLNNIPIQDCYYYDAGLL